jgi:BirA family transcriptional regulator, biotin operon repressor / biotin---[acetyl-CoA-carboxylase] ligase
MSLGRAWELPRDLLEAREFLQASGSRLGLPLAVQSVSESTSSDAKEAAKRGAAHGATWVSDLQTQGRGRQGRAWHSVRGEQLMFSTVLRPTCAAERLPLLSILTGLAVADAVDEALGGALSVALKWPNDVWVSGKKVAGILLESSLAGSRVEAVTIGVGINVHNQSFPEDLAPFATSLALVLKHAHENPSPDTPPWETARNQGGCREGTARLQDPSGVHRGRILASVLTRLDRDVDLVLARGLGLVHARLSQRDALCGKPVLRDDGVRGTARGIDSDGALRVELASGMLETWRAGEVHLVRAEGAAQ